MGHGIILLALYGQQLNPVVQLFAVMIIAHMVSLDMDIYHLLTWLTKIAIVCKSCYICLYI